jgi:uncharacterized protein YjlB
MEKHELFYFNDDGIFPNSTLPVVLYKKAVDLPPVLASRHVKKLLQKNNWSNNWKYGIIQQHHYHSTSHEVLVAIKGKTQLMLGGVTGKIIEFEKGDMLIIPAGVAHKNLQHENDIVCVGGYPEGRIYDMNYGRNGERPETDKNIAALPVPEYDPMGGKNGFLVSCWKSANNS